MTEEKLKETKLRFFNENQRIFQNNQELMSLYNEYTKRVAQLFNLLMNKESNLFYTIVFNILIEISFFSFNHTFNNNSDSFKEISIISGDGVCRNIACFYEDIFKNIYNYPF